MTSDRRDRSDEKTETDAQAMETNRDTSLVLKTSLVEMLGEENLAEKLGELAEFVGDQFLEEGVARDLPIIGLVGSLAKFGRAVNEYFFVEKLLRFREELESIPLETRRSFVKSLQDNPKEEQRVGQALLLRLDKADQLEKANMMGRTYRAFVEGKIDRETYDRLQTAIARVNTENIASLVRLYQNYDPSKPSSIERQKLLDEVAVQDLVLAGLVDVRLMGGIMMDSSPSLDGVGELAVLFIEIAVAPEMRAS